MEWIRTVNALMGRCKSGYPSLRQLIPFTLANSDYDRHISSYRHFILNHLYSRANRRWRLYFLQFTGFKFKILHSCAIWLAGRRLKVPTFVWCGTSQFRARHLPNTLFSAVHLVLYKFALSFSLLALRTIHSPEEIDMIK